MADTFYRHELQLLENELNLAQKRATARENSARQAISQHSIMSIGVGQKRLNSPLAFGVHFRDQPHFSSGCLTVKNPNSKQFADPVGICGVWAWERDARGFYTGARIWWRVDAYLLDNVDVADSGTTTPVTPVMRVQHDLTFSGIAFKDLPSTGYDETMTPLSSGLNDSSND